nr:MAG TPA: hypothetical protein [Caudoviricetes sp.]DAK96793.1 MAG TPA: hypothetical protein [Caudoviricetes sp.]DAR43582.1 MAG TPA: hypothetical protein [Caudoviricetes sp.]DAV15919.1 MAG TPA: hypothetical protein [Caudoviricetes sp.]
MALIPLPLFFLEKMPEMKFQFMEVKKYGRKK